MPLEGTWKIFNDHVYGSVVKAITRALNDASISLDLKIRPHASSFRTNAKPFQSAYMMALYNINGAHMATIIDNQSKEFAEKYLNDLIEIITAVEITSDVAEKIDRLQEEFFQFIINQYRFFEIFYKKQTAEMIAIVSKNVII